MSRVVKRVRRSYTEEFRQEAVALLADGHTVRSVATRLGIDNINLLYHWRRRQLEKAGPVASTLDARVQTLEAELQRVTRERDILKKALSIFSRHE